MKWLLIGHRGTGKTSLTERLKKYLEPSNVLIFDLDKEIELAYKKPVFDLFTEGGEAEFRIKERLVFNQIDKKHTDYILSLGAGFELGPELPEIPKGTRVLWVKRETDHLGRVFFDRPRLNKKISAIKEFSDRFLERQSKYLNLATEIYIMPEGIGSPNPIEKRICLNKDIVAGGVLTLTPWHLKTSDWPCLGFSPDYFEVRDDLVEVSCLLKIPKEKRLLSLRDKSKMGQSLKLIDDVSESDWALELGPCPSDKVTIVSSHEMLSQENLEQFLLRLERSAKSHQHLKASPVIRNYLELGELIKWQEADPKRRSILPRSPSNDLRRWTWTRLYQKGRQKLNFWRDGDSTASDQPTLFEWMATPIRPVKFAALLGNPVSHSKTMMEQHSFFAEKGWPVWAIPLMESEFQVALKFLIKKGLRSSAITSPLKKLAFLACEKKSKIATGLKSVNTIAVTDNQEQISIQGHNTDLMGFETLINQAASLLKTDLKNLKAVVWGGGGTLSTIHEILPGALELSVRSGLPRDLSLKIPKSTQVLIWAASPRDPLPPEFHFDIIVDLNYREDSRARELSIDKSKPYISGDVMFKSQAVGQREFWAKN